MSRRNKIFLALALAIPFGTALAETATTEVKQVPTLYKIEQRVGDKIEKIDKRIEDVKGKLELRGEKIGEKINKLEDKASTTKEKLQNKLEDVKNRIASSTERKLTNQQNQVINLTSRTVDKLNAAIVRDEMLSSRTKERATIFVNDKKLSVDTKSAIDAKLAEAATILEAAKVDAGKILDAAKTALTTEKPKDAFKEVTASAKKVQDEIKSAHAKIVEAIAMIRANMPKENKGDNKDATSTENR